MFILTQFIGLYVIDNYSPTKIIDGQTSNVTSLSLPYGMESPEVNGEADYLTFFYSIIIAFVLAILILYLLTHFNANIIIKLWFFTVVVLALGIAINAFIPESKYASMIALVIALPLAFIKIYKQNFIVHNFTELLIYPGIAAVFIPILNLKTIIFLLLVISVYDMWAVWKSGIMQKMAKYQIQKLNIFSGFFVPYVSKKMKEKIKAVKKMPKKKQEKFKNKKIKVNVAILGGGDIVFTLLAAGVMLKEYGFTTIAGFNIPLASIFVIFGAALGLGYLFFRSEKKKFYPAMPFITTGIFLGMILSYLVI